MEDAQRLFEEAVTEQVARLESALAALRAGTPGAEETVRRLAHSAGGSGASCGFPEVTELARVVERSGPSSFASSVERLLEGMRAMATPQDRRLVLVVDDDPLISRLLEMRLAAPDRRIVSVDTLTGARRALEAERPDALILDLFLPDGDGRSLLAALRGEEATSTLPVIVISASSSTRAECEALGADGFVHKPFEPEAVAALVATILARARTPGAVGGRARLMAAFRGLLAAGHPVSITSILPETHGPGGRRSEGPDPHVLLPVVEAIGSTLPARCVVAEWTEGEAAIVAHATADVASALDRARLRLRNQGHPSLPGAIVSFSAATIRDDGSGGLVDAHARARQFALDANRAGGDRVVVPSAPPRTRRVLLAEEDRVTAAMIINRLEQEGFDVEHHPDGVSALEAAERTPFGLVVIDVHLPGLGGLEVLGKMRDAETMRDVPIVVVAAAGSEREVVRGFELGADDYILKPFSPAELSSRLSRFTAR